MFDCCANSMFDSYITRTLGDIFPNVSDFKQAYNDLNYPSNSLIIDNLDTIYNLLMGDYMSSHIKSSSEDQFKLRFFSLIFRLAPTTFRKAEIQQKLQALTDDEMMIDGLSINNHANNPSTQPSTSSIEELTYIDNQTTARALSGKTRAYYQNALALEKDPYESFIKAFKPLFVSFGSSTTYLYKDILE